MKALHDFVKRVPGQAVAFIKPFALRWYYDTEYFCYTLAFVVEGFDESRHPWSDPRPIEFKPFSCFNPPCVGEHAGYMHNGIHSAQSGLQNVVRRRDLGEKSRDSRQQRR